MLKYNNWNPILTEVIDLKRTFLNVTKNPKMLYAYKYQDGTVEALGRTYDLSANTCIEYWVNNLKDKHFTRFFKFLHITEYNDLILVKYKNYADLGKLGIRDFNQLFTMHDGAYKEARSVVIDFKNEELVLTPFKKFFNYGEVEETSEENIKDRLRKAKSIEVSTKLDGSLQQARYYQGEYIMAGSTALDVNNSWRLADGKTMLMSNQNLLRLLKDYPDFTFMFEYLSKADAHVVVYPESMYGLHLIGMRNVLTGEELPYHDVIDLANKYNVSVTTLHPVSFNKVLADRDSRKAYEAEGFVISIDGYKVKVKYTDYALKHNVLSKLVSYKFVLQSLIDNTYDDLVANLAGPHQEKVRAVASIILEVAREIQVMTEYYAGLALQAGDLRAAMIWITENAPEGYKGLVRSYYKGTPINVLTTKILTDKVKLEVDKLYTNNAAEEADDE